MIQPQTSNASVNYQRIMQKPKLSQTRETLLRKIKDQHDEQSWGDFVHYYQSFIYNIIRKMNVSHHDAEDLVQQVIFKAWTKLPTFDYDPDRGNFRGWLCRVTTNEVKMFFRKNKSVITGLLETLQTLAFHEDMISDPKIKSVIENEWKNHVAKLAWESVEKKFNDKAKACYKMLADEKPVREISSELEIAESSVYVYKMRIQKILDAEISHLNNELT